ncbi:hypothetical protein M0805_005325 [Coniferiporia weirii]|nr:hypothetical protein M0805_005325 [Coniferiporia weirii]
MLFCRSGSVLFTATVTLSYSGILDGSVVPNTEFVGLSSTCPFDYTLWHRRFAHLNHSSVKKLIQGKLVDGVQLDSTASPDPICEPCIAGKQTHADVPKSVSSRRSNLLELVHGPLPVHSREGHYQYWITFICDASQWWSLIPLQKKSDAFAAFKQFKAYAENQTGCKIKAIRDDKGGEYMSKEWENLCIDEGIKREHTLQAEPHQNGVAERANQSISQSITAMISEACLPSHFWMDAVAAYVHVRNRSPTSAVKDATPFEVWHKKQPDVSHFRVFGCRLCAYQVGPEEAAAVAYHEHTIVSNSVVFDERYHPGTSKSPIDLSVPGDPVEAGGDKRNQVEFDLPQSPPPLPPVPPALPAPAPPPAPAPSPSLPSPPAPQGVIAAFPDKILALFNDCLRMGHHPKCWQAAKVVMLQKPNKKDPFSPRSYCPITLEETLGKLLEKMLANWLQFLTNEENWLPPNQYGGRQGHSVYDATQHLLQLVEGAHSTNQVCSVFAVDIQGFFDSVHPQLLHQQLLTMGCPPNMVDWFLSFMTGHKVAISFNGTMTPLTPKPDLGTPQGSPASPILSTIFAGLVLCRFTWCGCKLLTYIDNHLIICVGTSVTANCKTLANAYCHLNRLFNQLGLNIEAAKTEALHFHPPHCKTSYHGWDTMGIQIDDQTLVRPSIPLCWLGIWWDPGLSFKPHVEHMCSKGLSTLAALHILGNTKRGTSALHLQQLYSACVRTVLAWGVPVWYHGRSQKTLVNHLQAVQNTACRWILGIYKGVSPFSTNFLCSLPPFFAYFEYLKTNHALHLWRTPHSIGRRHYLPRANIPFPLSLQAHVPCVQQVPVYMHPPWVDPLAFRQGRISFSIPPVPVPSEVFTNGSRLGQKAGSAIVAMSRPLQLSSHRLTSPLCATATDAEQFSLGIAPGWATCHLRESLAHVSDVVFMSNSLTALNLYKCWPSTSGANLLPLWKSGVQTLLDSFPQLHVHFAWSPGHEDIGGNEWTDLEAKATMRLPHSNLPPSISTLKEQATLMACPPMWTPRKILTLLVDHPHCELSTVAQVLCRAGPYGGYWLSFDSAYRHMHGLISYC